ncbi:hypothetical protein EMCRGX_G020508 [Ephydatia muelleri]
MVASIAGDVATFWASAGKGNEELQCRECDAFLEFATNSEQRRQTNRSCSATMLKETLQKKTTRAFRVRWDHYVVGAMRSGMGQHFLKDRLNVRQADEVVMVETAAVMLEAAAVEREAVTATKKTMKASAVARRPVRADFDNNEGGCDSKEGGCDEGAQMPKRKGEGGDTKGGGCDKAEGGCA